MRIDLEHEDKGTFDEGTPTAPLPLVTRARPKTHVVGRLKGRSWDPPPLRRLMKSTPPPPRSRMRSQLELDCATAPPAGVFAWDPSPAAGPPTRPPLVTRRPPPPPRKHRPKLRAYAPWIAATGAYALGLTTMFAVYPEEANNALARVADAAHAANAFEPPPLSKTVAREPEPEVSLAEAEAAVETVAEDVPPARRPTQLDFGRKPTLEQPTDVVAPLGPVDISTVRVTIGAAAAHAAAICGDGESSGTTRVSVTLAPSGRATSAVLLGGPFNGTSVGSCIANVMRNVHVPPFAGDHVTVTKTVAVR